MGRGRGGCACQDYCRCRWTDKRTAPGKSRSPFLLPRSNDFSKITNSAPNHAVLGTLNGLAQTLSAAGRAAGPFLAGGLFSIATTVRPKGEALAFGVFGGLSFLGFLLSFGIKSPNLEAEGWDDGEESDKSGDEEP